MVVSWASLSLQGVTLEEQTLRPDADLPAHLSACLTHEIGLMFASVNAEESIVDKLLASFE